MFLCQSWYLRKEKETSFLTLFTTNFVLTGILCSKSGRQREAPPILVINKGFVFFS